MSGKRNVVFAEGEVYHVFNRSVANEQIFVKKKDIDRALGLIEFYRFEQRLRFSFFERLPNEEKTDYINKLSKETPLVDVYTYSLLSNHFHFNPVTAYLMEFDDLKESNLTSFPIYIDPKRKSFVNTELILKLAGSTKNYEKFVADQVDYQRRLSKIKHLLLE